MNIGHHVRAARKQKGLTQEQLAENTNLSLSTIKRIEGGKTKPRIYTLNILSDILEIDLLANSVDSKMNSTVNNDGLRIVLTSILLLICPPFNIIYLLNLWYRQREKMFFESIGKKLLFFQMTSFIILLIAIFAAIFITLAFTGQKIYGQIHSPLILYMVFFTINILAALTMLNKANFEKWHYNDTKESPLF